MPHLPDDRVVQLGVQGYIALSSEETTHLGECVDCRTTVAEVSHAMWPASATNVVRHPLIQDPPEGLWKRIEVEADIEPSDGRVPGDGWRRVWRFATAILVGCAVGSGVTAAVLARGGDEPAVKQPKGDTVASATLSVPAGSGSASGTAKLVRHEDRWLLVVDARGLRSGNGYFEVWLLDAQGRMYALGALPESDTARLLVPAGIPLTDFNIVDISAQEFNGDPTHSRNSVLRGTLRG